jgi:hypothetical protein
LFLENVSIFIFTNEKRKPQKPIISLPDMEAKKFNKNIPMSVQMP